MDIKAAVEEWQRTKSIALASAICEALYKEQSAEDDD